mgnify:CR=1 FL=1
MRNNVPISSFPNAICFFLSMTPDLCCGFASSCLGIWADRWSVREKIQVVFLRAFRCVLVGGVSVCFGLIFSSFFFRSLFLRFFAAVQIFHYNTPRSRVATQSSAVSFRNAKKKLLKNANCVMGSKLCSPVHVVRVLIGKRNSRCGIYVPYWSLAILLAHWHCVVAYRGMFSSSLHVLAY